jgi:hypothetical protein
MTSNEALVQLADDAYEAVRALNHGTFRTTPAPLVYDLTGNLKAASWGLAQLAEQMGSGLRRSLAEYDVYDNKRDAAESVTEAETHLQRAAQLARDLGQAFELAQQAINQQGYNDTKPTTQTANETPTFCYHCSYLIAPWGITPESKWWRMNENGDPMPDGNVCNSREGGHVSVAEFNTEEGR